MLGLARQTVTDIIWGLIIIGVTIEPIAPGALGTMQGAKPGLHGIG